jgi:hypothetical protein
VGKTSVEDFMHVWLELLNYQLDRNVLMTVEALPGVDVINLHRPLCHMDHFVSQVAELHVRKVLSELVDRFFRENGFDEVMAVTHKNCGNYLNYENFEILDESCWEIDWYY